MRSMTAPTPPCTPSSLCSKAVSRACTCCGVVCCGTAAAMSEFSSTEPLIAWIPTWTSRITSRNRERPCAMPENPKPPARIAIRCAAWSTSAVACCATASPVPTAARSPTTTSIDDTCHLLARCPGPLSAGTSAVPSRSDGGRRHAALRATSSARSASTSDRVADCPAEKCRCGCACSDVLISAADHCHSPPPLISSSSACS